MRHIRFVSVAPATEDPEALQRFREVFFFRLLVTITALAVRK